MKKLLPVFIITFATSLHAEAADSLDELFYRRAQKTLISEEGINQNYFFDDVEHQLWREKLKMKGSWKYSLDEWESLLRGNLIQPEYYFDEDLKVSNGGWCIG